MKVFNRLKQKNEAAFIPYLTAGYPDMERFLGLVEEIAGAGADIIEIGYPFSDPVADGPMIQHSSQISLEGGITMRKLISALKEVRTEVPLVLMSYLNPVVAYGDGLWKELSGAGFSGVVIPDMPAEEAEPWAERAEDAGISQILLVTPASTGERISMIASRARGFIYCVSIAGTTGERKSLSRGLIPFVKNIKKLTDTPVAVGFGISTPEQAGEVAAEADGVIVGSRIVKAIESGEDVGALVSLFKQSTRRI